MKAVGAGRSGRWKIALHLVAFALGAAGAHSSSRTTWPFLTPPPPVQVETARALPASARPPGRAPAARTMARATTISARSETAPRSAQSVAEPIRAAAPADLDPLGQRYRDGLIVTGSTPHRIILFTFDDGPDPRTTPLLLDRLDESGVKAVFFLVASRMTGATPIERHQIAIAREIARRGHLIGGHTLDHVQLPLLDDEQIEHQLDESERILERALGGIPKLFRPPFGAHSERVDQHLVAHHYTTVLWNLGAGDFQVRTTDEVFDTWLKVLERREREHGDRGGIILLHDTYAWSVDAFERIFAYLQAQNCVLLERGEELYDVVDDLSFFYVPRGDADEEVEAPPARPHAEVLASRQAALRERTARRCKSLASAY